MTSQIQAAHAQTKDNLSASFLIVLAMFVFTFEDYLLKKLAVRIPPGELVILASMISGSAVVLWALARGHRLWSRQMLCGSVLVRNLAEFASTIVGITALIANPLSLHSAVFQATPLVVTIGAVLYLRERPGIARYLGTFAGLIGVLLIIAPGTAGFRPMIILSLLSVFAVAVRDIATRTIPTSITSLELVLASNLVSVPAGIILLAVQRQSIVIPAVADLTVYTIAILVATLGGFALTIAIRKGEASFVVPFRYSRILFAMVIGAVLLHEQITTSMLAGSAILVVAGIWVVWTEGRSKRRKAAFLDADRPI